MLFTKDNSEKADKGLKTQTRRPVKSSDFPYYDYNAAHIKGHSPILAVYVIDEHGNMRLKWEVGRTYANQPGRGKKAPWWQWKENPPTFVLTFERVAKED